MANALMIRGELAHDIELLGGEIRRISLLSADLKERRAALVSLAENRKEELKDDVDRLRQRNLNIDGFKSRLRTSIVTLRARFQQFVIEDNVLVQEIERAKSILEQFKKEFNHVQNMLHLGDAEAKITFAEAAMKVRLDFCKQFISKGLNPLLMDVNLINSGLVITKSLEGVIRIADARYDEVRKFAQIVDDLTLKTVGYILKFYGTLLKRYPLLVHEAWEKERWGKNKRRMLE